MDKWYKKHLEETGEEIDFLRLSKSGKPEHYIPPSETKLASTLWNDLKPNGSSQLKALFNKKVFDNPKSIDLIKRIIRFAEGEKKDTLILDSFAGSGTTMQAVMELNKEDEGSRRCILIQMSEATEKEPDKNICRDITRERIKKAIEKYDYDSGFEYYILGVAIDPYCMLNGNLPTYIQLARYIYYLCTGEYLSDDTKIDESNYFVSSKGQTIIHLIYNDDYEILTSLALNLVFAEKITEKYPNRKHIVYAPAGQVQICLQKVRPGV